MEDDMKNLDETQKEALEVAAEYIGKLIPGIESLVKELTVERKEDTVEFTKLCMDGLNWIVNIYNATADLFEQEEFGIDKEETNHAIMALDNALKNRDDQEAADCLCKGVLPFLHKLAEAIKRICS